MRCGTGTITVAVARDKRVTHSGLEKIIQEVALTRMNLLTQTGGVNASIINPPMHEEAAPLTGPGPARPVPANPLAPAQPRSRAPTAADLGWPLPPLGHNDAFFAPIPSMAVCIEGL